MSNFRIIKTAKIIMEKVNLFINLYLLGLEAIANAPLLLCSSWQRKTKFPIRWVYSSDVAFLKSFQIQVIMKSLTNFAGPEKTGTV